MKKPPINHILNYFLLAILIFSLPGCKKDKDEPEGNRKEVFYAEYRNQISAPEPELKVDTAQLPEVLKLGNYQVSTPGDRVHFTFSNVKLVDSKGNYVVLDAKTEVQRNGKYEEDPETFLTTTLSQSVDVALVLDVSSSLGTDVANVREYAMDFVQTIYDSIPNAKIGIVIFSKQIISLPLTNNLSSVQNFINQNTVLGDNSTMLYEAMDKGLSLLSSSNADSKNIVTFTDGKNNDWTDEVLFGEPDTIKQRLTNLINGTTVNSYLIGLDGKVGGVDKTILNSLVMNGGISAFPHDVTALKAVFDKFAKSVATVYTFVYDRNNANIEDWKKLKFILEIKLK